MPSIIEFNGKKYDSLTGRMVATRSKAGGQIDVKKVFKPTKIEIKSEATPAKTVRKPAPKTTHKASHSERKTEDRKHRVEKPQTLMRASVKKAKHEPASEHKAPPRVGWQHEAARERARRAKQVQKSTAIIKFSKSAPKRRSETEFTSKPLPVALPPVIETVTQSVVSQAEQMADKLEDAVQSAESHLETYAGKKLKTKKSRKLAYSLASLTSVFLIGFAVYQAVPFVQVKLASNNAGFSASLPGYAPSGYGLDNNLQANSGIVTMTYSSQAENKNYKITQTPSKWNSDSLLNNYVLTSGEGYKSLDQDGRTVYIYDGEKAATWLDGGIWYRLDGANNFSNDQLLRIVQGL